MQHPSFRMRCFRLINYGGLLRVLTLSYLDKLGCVAESDESLDLIPWTARFAQSSKTRTATTAQNTQITQNTCMEELMYNYNAAKTLAGSPCPASRTAGKIRNLLCNILARIEKSTREDAKPKYTENS